MPAATSGLKRLLQRYEDPETRSKVLRIVQQFGLKEDDPVFMLMVGTAQVQTLLERGPNQLRQTFEQMHQQMLGKLDGYEQAARRGVEKSVASAVQDLVAKTERSKARVGLVSMIDGTAAIAGVLIIGLLAGASYRRFTTSFDPGGPRQLTLEQAEALQWATSDEGRYAQQLMSWNEDLLGGQCQEQVANLGVTIQMGTQKAESGFCLIWTQPPGQRNFVDAGSN